MLRKALPLFLGNLTSKGLGLLREVLFAAWFGTSDTAAAFRVAQTGFLMPTHALIGDALSAGLLPLYRLEQQSDLDRARVLMLVASLYGLVFSAIVTPVLYLFSNNIAAALAPGASIKAQALAGDLLKIMALATPFYVLSGLLSYLETAFGRYSGISWRPTLLNLGSIAGAGLAVFFKQDHWLATGILVSHVAFFVWTAFQMSRLDRLWPQAKVAAVEIMAISGRFLHNLLPLLGLPLAAQSTVFAERVVSSWIGTEVIPAADYARFICDTMVQLIAVPLGILTMSTRGGTSATQMHDHVAQVTQCILLIACPIGLFLSLHAEIVVTLLFARGAFDAAAVETTSAIMVWMSGVLGLTVTAYYLVKVLNAQMRNRAALAFTVIAGVASIAVNVSLWRVFGAQVVGLAVVFYALMLFVLSATALKLWTVFGSILPWLAFGLAIQFALNFATQQLSTSSLIGFCLDLALTVSMWMVLLYVAPPLNAAAAPLLMRLPWLSRFRR